MALVCSLLAFGVSSALAEELSPQWTITSVSLPTNLTPEDSVSGENFYRVIVTNTGNAASNGTVVIDDNLSTGLTLDPEGIFDASEQVEGKGLICSGSECMYSEPVVPGDSLKLSVPVDTGAPGSVTNVVTVSGGGAAEASKATPTRISATPAVFGIAPGSANTTLSSDQAGAHADLTTTIGFNTDTFLGALPAAPKDTTDNLPPGFAGDLADTPACTVAYFSSKVPEQCPVDTQVGSTTITFEVNGFAYELITPVYNLVANPGTTAKLAFYAEIFGIQGDVLVRPGDEGLETTFHNTDQATNEIDSVVLTIWGVPNAPTHNALRGLYCHHAGVCQEVGGAAGASVAPFLTNPTSCSGELLEAEFKAVSWEQAPGSEAPSERRRRSSEWS